MPRTYPPLQPDRFTYQTFAGMNPEFVDLERDADPDTAWCWTLHVRVPDTEGVDDFHQILLQRTHNAHSWLGEADTHDNPSAVGGDSFAGWCEPLGYGGEDDNRALHLYFGAPDADCARALAVAFLALTGLTHSDVALSTGGDWAEQTPIPMLPRRG